MKKRILVVDDEKKILELVSESLEMFGYDVIIGHNGQEAVKLFRDEKPDLVLLDVRMPIKDGFEAYREIKNQNKDAKIIFMSAYPIENELYTKIRENGMGLFLNKPFSLQTLKETISELIAV